MSFVTAALHLIALVLVVSGAQKVVAPADATQAMRDARLPFVRSTIAGRSLGGVELAIGLTAIATPARGAAVAVALTYLGFTAFILRLRSQDQDAGCGCFNAGSTPPGSAHIVLNVASATVATLGAATGISDIVTVFDDGVVVGASYVTLLALGSLLLLLGPALFAELHHHRATPEVPTFSVRRGPA